MKKQTFLKEMQTTANLIAMERVELRAGTQPRTSHEGPVWFFAGDPRCPVYRKKALASVVHECFHKRYTDMRPEKMTAWATKLGGHIANCMEDGRIEKVGSFEYQGARKMLLEGYQILINEGFWKVPESKGCPISAFTSFLLYYVRAHWAGQEIFADHLKAAKAIIKQDLPMSIFAPVKALLDSRLNGLNSSDAVNELSLEIVELLRKLKEEEEEKQQQQQDEQDQNDQGQDSVPEDEDSNDQNQSGSGSEEDDSDEQDSGDAGSNSEEGDSEEGESDGQDDESDSDDSGDGVSYGGEDSQDIIDALEKILNADEDDLEELSPEDAFQDSLQEDSEGFLSHFPVEAVVAQQARYRVDAEKVLLSTNSLKTKMKRLFESKAQTKVEAAKRGKRLLSNKLVTVRMGNRKVYEKTTSQDGDNTVFSILMDASGSMAGREMEITCESGFALSKALEAIPGVENEVSLFGYHYDDNYRSLNTVIKQFGQKAKPENFGFDAPGGTPLSESMLTCGQRLMSRPEPRKILIVLTDGQPDCSDGTRYAVEELEENGIELIGIGIQSISVKRFFKNHEVINDVSELPNVMFNVAKEALKL